MESELVTKTNVTYTTRKLIPSIFFDFIFLQLNEILAFI